MEAFIRGVMLKAGKELMRFYGTDFKTHRKGSGVNDVMTDADLNAEKIITDAIRKRFPSHAIIAEEGTIGANQDTAEYVWCIDPLDGTRNFIRNVPLFGIIIGVACKGVLKYGAIYLPATKEFCFAEKGKGVTLNGKRIHCSNLRDFNVSYGIGPVRASEKSMVFWRHIIEKSKVDGNIWMSGIASPAVSCVYVASGRRDWYFSRGSKTWDYAGSVLLMQEAGCKVTDAEGKPWKLGCTSVVAANPSLHKNLLGIKFNT